MENFNIYEIPEMEDDTLKQLVENLEKNFKSTQTNFAITCRDVYRIWAYCKESFYAAKNKEFYNAYTLLEKFGFDKKAVSRLKNCYLKFCNDCEKNVQLRDIFKDFSPSKLYELLPLEDDMIYELYNKKVLKPVMTVKAIRQLVNQILNGEEGLVIQEGKIDFKEEVNEDEIPPAYDPKKFYEFEYFKSKSKNQLLNMIWALQKEYQNRGNKKV